MVIFTLILALAFAIAAVIFALQNAITVTVSFFGYPVEGSLALFILLSVAVGIIIGILVMSPSVIKRSLALRSQRKKIGGLEASLDEQKARVAELEKPAAPSPAPKVEKQ